MPVRLAAAREPFGPAAFARRRSAALEPAPRACRSLLIWDGRRFGCPAAPQHSLVNINENTSTAAPVRNGSGPELTDLPCEKRPPARVQCKTSLGRTSRTTTELEAGTRVHGTRDGAVPRRECTTASRRTPTAGADRCRSLLIPRSQGPAEPAKACRWLLIHRIPPAEPVGSGGRAACRHGHRPARRPPSRLTESGGRL
jgi:hypothetical protein